MRKAVPLTLIILFILSVACSPPQPTEPAAGGSDVTPIMPTTSSPTDTPPPSITAIAPSPVPTEAEQPGTIPPAMTPTFVPSPTAVSAASPLSGVVYQTPEGLWKIDAAGDAVILSTRPALDLSPDGTQGLYSEEGDVWIVDLPDGEPRNVTAGSGREHVYAQWWPARPQTLILGSWGEGDQGPNTGRLTLVETDGSNYRVVNPDGELSYALPDPAPDGQTIAYDEAGQGMVYNVEDGVMPFDPHAYGLPQEIETPRVASPSWSPDGSRLAWVVGLSGGEYGSGGSWDAAVAVFDLQAQSVQLLHPFQPIGRGGWFTAPAWSPDGQWLAFLIESQDQSEYGLWVLAPDGSAEQQLNQGASAQAWWEPSGGAPGQNDLRLLLGVSPPEGGVTYSIVTPSTWEQAPVSLPPQALVHDWRALP